MAQNRPHNLSDKLIKLKRSEWLNIINENIKNETDRFIAEKYYLDGWCQQDIAEETNYSRSAIKKRLYKILNIIYESTK